MGSRQSTVNSPSRVVQATSDDNSATQIGGDYSTTLFRSSRTNSSSDTDQLTNRDWRQRARSFTSAFASDSRPPRSSAIEFSRVSSQDIFNEDSEYSPSFSFTPHSLPLQLFQYHNLKCPFCSKVILPNEIECHLVLCITKPILSYNEDILTEDKGECVICLEEMLKGNKIARLPCLCIYHKSCIDAWFNVNRSCPEHPMD